MGHPKPKRRPTRATIYVIDDDVAMGRAVSISLRHMLDGVEVRVFVDPHRAYQAIVEDPPHVVLTDHDMPRCTGVEFAEALRKALGPRCPRIALVSGATVTRAHLRLFDAHFRKPFQLADLAAAVERWVSPGLSGTRRRVRHDTPTQPY